MYNIQYDNLLGFVEKSIRKQLDYTIENVADRIGVSKGWLSEVENGLRTMKPETFQKFIETYGIEFNYSEELSTETEELLDNILHAFVSQNVSELNNLLHFYLERRDLFLNSFGVFNCYLIEGVFDNVSRFEEVEIDNYFFSKATKQAEEFLKVFDSIGKALACFLQGFKVRTKKISLAIEYFEKALQYLGLANCTELAGVIKFNLSILVGRSISYSYGLALSKEAEEIFIANGNLSRAVKAAHNQAIYLTEMGAYDISQQILERILSHSHQIKDMELPYRTRQHKIMNLCLSGQYRNALIYMNEIKDDINHIISNFPLAPYCLYQLNRSEDALRVMKELKSYHLEQDDKHQFRLLTAIIKGNVKKVKEEEKKLVKVLNRQYNWQIMVLIYKLMVRYSEETGDKNGLINSLKNLIRIANHEFPESIYD